MSEEKKADIRQFQEHISAYDPWGPPLDVLGELYESVDAVNAAPMRDMRVSRIERAANAAEAWMGEMREFVTATLVQQFEESQASEDLARTEEFQALPQEAREIHLRSMRSVNQRTAETIDMFFRVWGEYPDIPVSKGCEVFLECPSWDLVHSTNRYLDRREGVT
ncbi:hypothetical protein [Mycobacteroides chelonae]|uniref:hypothetical protein n=1 Tax=Mycobacteroides chelonae TaxID=1774 RepID=UPI0009946C1B|nr:hypothetical protein [Mycobacteroides chelonae]